MADPRQRGWTEEFKREAVRLLSTSGQTVGEVAAALGVGKSTRTHWRRRFQEADLLAKPHPDAERELARLRRENEILRQEWDLLKKRRPSSPRRQVDEVPAHRCGDTFGRSRDLAAWLRLLPRQATTGGKPKLLGITKRRSKYLRKLLIQGARAAMPSLSRTATPLGNWLRGLLARAHGNVVVALASELARIAWALLRHEADFAVPRLAAPKRRSARSVHPALRVVGSLRVVEARWPDSRPVFRKPDAQNGTRSRPFHEARNARVLHLGQGFALRPDTVTQTAHAGSLKPLADGAGHTLRRLATVRCALRGVASIIRRSGSPARPASPVKIRLNTPRRLHRTKRWYRVLCGPYSAAASRQRSPLRMTWRMPLTTRWSSTRATPCESGK
jgi:transposase